MEEQKSKQKRNFLQRDFTFPWTANEERQYFFESLAEMLASGIDIIVAIDSLRQESKSPRIKKLCEELKFELENGSTIWKALETRRLLPPHLLTLVKIGEESGNLAKNLKVVIDQQKKDRQFKSALRSASIYPLFVFVLMLVVGFAVALFILPRLSSVYTSLNVDLPFITKVMIELGNFFQNYGIIAVPGFFIFLGLIFYILFFNKRTKHLGQKLLLKLPIIKRLIQEVEIARMGYLVGTLLKSGFPVVDAFNILSYSATFNLYKQLYEFIAESINQGRTFKQTFESIKKIEKIMPIYPRQLIITGEKTGVLPDSFLKISEFYERKNEESIKNIGTLFEPVLLLAVWLGVAAIALAVILPIYSLIGNLTSISDGTAL